MTEEKKRQETLEKRAKKTCAEAGLPFIPEMFEDVNRSLEALKEAITEALDGPELEELEHMPPNQRRISLEMSVAQLTRVNQALAGAARVIQDIKVNS